MIGLLRSEAQIWRWYLLPIDLAGPAIAGDIRKPWPRVMLEKTGNTEYSCLGDLDGGGRLDILGDLIHNDGHQPKDKASVHWMEYEGNRPGTARTASRSPACSAVKSADRVANASRGLRVAAAAPFRRMG